MFHPRCKRSRADLPESDPRDKIGRGVSGVLLSVGDDGIGIMGDHSRAKPGLGTGIVNALAGQL